MDKERVSKVFEKGKESLGQTKDELATIAKETGGVLVDKAKETGLKLGVQAQGRVNRLRTENRQFKRVESFYWRYQKYQPVLTFFAGFLWDSFTLTRIDRLRDNLILALYLILVLSFVILSNLQAKGLLAKNPRLLKYADYYPAGMQFFLGSLFSAYVVFYFQSASFSKNLLFVGLLVSMMVAVEVFKRRLGNLYLQLAMCQLVSHSFFAFLFPILLGRMGYDLFLWAGLFSGLLVILIWAFFFQAGVITRDKELYLGIGLVLLMFSGLAGLYRANLIPPVPLSLKHAGIYHSWEIKGDQYKLGFEPAPWYQFWRESDRPFHYAPGDQMVAFFALYAPIGLVEEVSTRWFWYDTIQAQWVFIEQRKVTIIGGRPSGWRNVHQKTKTEPGQWRVELVARENRLIGEVNFEVKLVNQPVSPLAYHLH